LLPPAATCPSALSLSPVAPRFSLDLISSLVADLLAACLVEH